MTTSHAYTSSPTLVNHTQSAVSPCISKKVVHSQHIQRHEGGKVRRAFGLLGETAEDGLDCVQLIGYQFDCELWVFVGVF